MGSLHDRPPAGGLGFAARLAGTAVLLAVTGCTATPADDPTVARHLEVADRVATWLTLQGRPAPGGIRWPMDADAATPRFATTLYHGSTGVVLFYLEHFAATGRPGSLERARQGANAVWQETGPQLDREQPGLYTGLAGIAWTLAELHRTTGAPRDRRRALACIDAVARRDLTNLATDIISGSAGIGLAALAVDGLLDHPPARALATRCGDALLARAQPSTAAAGGRFWWMQESYKLPMPNFSHGTAGVAYFLARLFAVTRDDRFLQGARAGAAHLLALTGDNHLIHHNPKKPDLFYLGWCHGPPGTARLFHALDDLTGEERYRTWTTRALQAILDAGIPARRTPGFWLNHGQCCGTAGVLDYLLREKLSDNPAESARAERVENMFKALVDAAIDDAQGMRWQTAEHRVRPKLRTTQTGYTQGAAGIGMLFLHDVARRRGAPCRIVFPDARKP